MYMVISWTDVADELADQPSGSKVRVAKHLVPHPADAGLRRSIGLPSGQRADYRLTLPDCRGLHVQDFGKHYEAHIDSTDPACDAILHLMRDAPATYVGGAALFGALVGGLLGRSGEAALAGALVGAAVAGVSAVAVHDPDVKTDSAAQVLPQKGRDDSW